MPIPLPNLDDRRYDDLVNEALNLIPAYAPEWTNRNPSDPGVTLVELFAYLSEMLLYRLNRVTDANLLAFVRLLNGPQWQAPKGAGKDELADAIRQAVVALRESNRLVSAEDFERLARQADPAVARALCVPRRNLESGNASAPSTDAPGHVSVIIVPYPAGGEELPRPSAELLRNIAEDFEPRRLLTTRVHLVGPAYLTLQIKISLVLQADAVEDRFRFSVAADWQADLDRRTVSDGLRQAFADNKAALSTHTMVSVKEPGAWLVADLAAQRTYTVRKSAGQTLLDVYEDVARAQAIHALQDYFHPLRGGRDGTGWPFGRSVYVSELYDLLDRLPSVDYVIPSTGAAGKALDELLTSDPSRLRYNPDGRLVAVALCPHELVDIQIVPDDIGLIAQQPASHKP